MINITTPIIASTIKMKLFDVNSNTYIHPNKEINDKDPTFKTGDTVRISIYKNIFAKDHVPNWSEGFVITKAKNNVLWASC